MSKDLLSAEERLTLQETFRSIQRNNTERTMRLRVLFVSLVGLYYLVLGAFFPERIARNFNFDTMLFSEEKFYALAAYRVALISSMLVIYNFCFWKKVQFFYVALVTAVIVAITFGYDFETFYLFAKPEAVIRISILVSVRIPVIYLLLMNVVDSVRN